MAAVYVAGAAGFLLAFYAVYAAIQGIKAWIASTNVQQIRAQIAQQAAASSAALRAQAATAYANGDQATGDQLSAEADAEDKAAAGGASTGWSAWLQQNTGMILASVFAIMAIGPVLGLIGGGRRR